ncbi:MAG: hypothetical protein U9R25_06195 [Chloroflexota bacterium]|nr:hypothetical protein [Chloroflexota bacterium]
MIKLLRTSDVQLDAPFTFLGERGARHRQQLRQTFARIVELAREDGCHMLLIAGDLFNDNHPSQNRAIAAGSWRLPAATCRWAWWRAMNVPSSLRKSPPLACPATT